MIRTMQAVADVLAARRAPSVRCRGPAARLTSSSMSSFVQQHPELHRLLIEFLAIRGFHTDIVEPRNAHDTEGFLFAEASLVFMALERFLRIVVPTATPRDKIDDLLESATGGATPLLTLPGPRPREVLIADVKAVRDALQHGNFEQAAKMHATRTPPVTNKREYFRTAAFSRDVHEITLILGHLLQQRDAGYASNFPKLPAVAS
jgi:hypothetical protein